MADPWQNWNLEPEVPRPGCPHHPQEEVWHRSGYCDLCVWALEVLEVQLTALLDDKPDHEGQKRFFFLCPHGHGFTSRQSGADAICRMCRNQKMKVSVASHNYEEMWPQQTEVGPDLTFEKPELSHARALMVRVDPNKLDLCKKLNDVGISCRYRSLEALHLVCQDVIASLGDSQVSKSASINQLCWRRDGPGAESVIRELQKIESACRMLKNLAEEQDLDVRQKRVDGAWSPAPGQITTGSFLSEIAFRNNGPGRRGVCFALETKGERWETSEQTYTRYRGLKVDKENHLVLILTSALAAQQLETLRHFPFHGFVEGLRSSLRAHHDQANCRGCDFLGRICGASKAKAMIKNFCGHNGMILVFKNLPYSDDGSTQVLVNDVIKEVQVSMQQRGYPPVHVQKMDIRPCRNNSFRWQDEIQAEVHVTAEVPQEVRDEASRSLRRRVQEAEDTVRVSFEGEDAVGILYAADYYGPLTIEPTSSPEFRRAVTNRGSECLGWISQHERDDLPSIRLISAPHWLRNALQRLDRELPNQWRLSRLNMSWEALTLLNNNFDPQLPCNRVEDICRQMRLTPVDAQRLQRAASVFAHYGKGLHQMGDFPSSTTYHKLAFYDELEHQRLTLLRHVYLFGNPTSAKKYSPMAGNVSDDASDVSGDEGDDDDTAAPDTPDLGTGSPQGDTDGDNAGTWSQQAEAPPSEPVQPQNDFNGADPWSSSPAATSPPSETAPSLNGHVPQEAAPQQFPEPRSMRLRCGRATDSFNAEEYRQDANTVYHDLEAGEWILWSKHNEDEHGHWCYGTKSNGKPGWVPMTLIRQAVHYEEMPLRLQAEILSNGFAEDYRMAQGGTCDVYQITLPSDRIVAAKVLHGQESKAVVCALHDEVRLFHSEVEALKRLSHENIAEILDWGVTGLEKFVILEEFVSNTHLGNCLGSIDFQQRLWIAASVADAISYVHEKEIIHRDVKSANVLVDFDAAGNACAVKLSDFGLAKAVQERAVLGGGSRFSSKRCGTTGYMDPETVRGDGCSTKKSDVYSFGIVLVDLITGNECGPQHDHYKAMKRRSTRPLTIHPSWSQHVVVRKKLEEYASECIHEFSEDRPHMAEIQRHLTKLVRDFI